MISGERVVARCRELAAITDVEGQTHRTFLSPAMQRCNARVGDWMRVCGASVVVDAAGSLRGRREGSGPGTVVIASHLDTVPNAGAFDGPMGVIIGVEVLELLRDRVLPFAIEIIGFSEEEGVRYGVPFIGSRAAVGTLGDDLLARRDAAGV
ncbi:MAG: M28 family peptidase, partial [Clostridia bacterium]|nr:M28 family peptidase [Deltaproteobacteria bacterium]